MVDPDFFRGKRVLVTGHTGFKGAWLTFWLQRMGAQVTGYALAPSTEPSLFAVLRLERGMTSHLADLREPARLAAVVASARPEMVFHLAAQALVGTSYAEPLATFHTNVVGTAALLDACRACEAVRAVVVVTSDKCYEVRPGDRPYREDDPLGGHDPYSASKAAAEIVVASWRRSFFDPLGKELASVRAGNVIGGGDFTRGRLIPDCLEAFAAGRTVRLRHPDAIRPWQHVLEPLSGYLQLAQRLATEPKEWARAWNFGPDDADAVPVRQVVEQCARQSGAKTADAAWEREPGEPPHETAVLRLDSTLARARLGWRPAWNLAAALERTVAWHHAFRAAVGAAKLADLMGEQIALHESARG